MPNFFAQYDPTTSTGRENVLSGGELAPWELAERGWNQAMGPGAHRFRSRGYDVDPAAFQDPNAEANKARYLGELQGAQGRQFGQFGGQQQDLASALYAQSMGQGPSLAQNQLQRATDRSLSQAAALQASQRGGMGGGLGARALQSQAAGLSQQAAGQSADLALAEQMQARQQLGGVLGQGRAQDLQTAAMNDEMVRYYEGLGFSTDQAGFAAAQALENLRVQEALGQQGINAQLAAGRNQLGAQLGGGGAGAVGTIGGALFSDERKKKNVASGQDAAESFLDTLVARTFDYRQPGPFAPAGRQLGVMAQDVERTPMGSQLVTNTPGGKMIDGNAGIGAVLAGEANLHERMKALEAKADPRVTRGGVQQRMMDQFNQEWEADRAAKAQAPRGSSMKEIIKTGAEGLVSGATAGFSKAAAADGWTTFVRGLMQSMRPDPNRERPGESLMQSVDRRQRESGSMQQGYGLSQEGVGGAG